MHKKLIAVTTLAILAGGVTLANATDIPELSGWGIRATTSSTPSIVSGGSQFYPVVNKFVGSADFSTLQLTNDKGDTFTVEDQPGGAMIQGHLDFKDLYYASWMAFTPTMQISYILSDPLEVGHVHFNSGSATLDAGDRAVLNAVAKAVMDNHLYGIYMVGSADPVGSYSGNLAISESRVMAAKNYLDARLHTLGVSNALITTEYMGDLLASGAPGKANASDRRVSVTIYPVI